MQFWVVWSGGALIGHTFSLSLSLSLPFSLFRSGERSRELLEEQMIMSSKLALMSTLSSPYSGCGTEQNDGD